MSTSSPPTARPPNVMGELGLAVEASGDELHGTADVLPTMWAPSTTSLRASVLLTWADTLLGLLALRVLAPRVPVTLELDVHLFGPIEGSPTVRSIARVTKAGSTVQVCSVDFLTETGQRVGFGHSLFMAAPDPRLSMPAGGWVDRLNSGRGTLRRPLAERIGCVRTDRGGAVLPCTPELLNASNTLNGGLMAIAVEEAALSATDAPTSITSLQMRYLRPVRTGAMARAVVLENLAEIEVRDAESDVLAALATARFADR